GRPPSRLSWSPAAPVLTLRLARSGRFYHTTPAPPGRARDDGDPDARPPGLPSPQASAWRPQLDQGGRRRRGDRRRADRSEGPRGRVLAGSAPARPVAARPRGPRLPPAQG